MLDYKITKVESKHCIEENATGHIIKTFEKYSDAKKFMKHLNLGGGFGGWTPNFFLKKANSPEFQTK